ncbi:MAG: GNAT family N-acetyltransferase [Pseudomonadota bacterium]
MSYALRIAPMSLEDLKLAIEWAAVEGWNPGLDDAAAFHAADPNGFLMGWLGDEPVSAISVVRHSEDFGFLGFYLCRPEHRGHGYGLATWQAGMSYLEDRVVGLDGVPAQQDNYAASGFALAHNTQRYAGRIIGQAHAGIRAVKASDHPDLLAFDRIISGADRSAYFAAWMKPASTRQTLLRDSNGVIEAIGTIRACREGHKIGPLFAPDQAVALQMIEALCAAVDAHEIMIDMPDPNASGADLVTSLGLEVVFSCARMYRGAPPTRDLTRIFGETTFELG